MTLDQFERELEAIIGRPTDLRPFVCEGSPLDCPVMVVGFNPATPMSGWWDFWREGYGFDKAAWLDAYKRARNPEPTVPGTRRKPQFTPTRASIERVVKATQPIRILETNLYAPASKSEKDLPADKRAIDLFGYLLLSVRPKAIIAHGKRARLAVARLAPDVPTITYRHFRFLKKERVPEVADAISAKLQ